MTGDPRDGDLAKVMYLQRHHGITYRQAAHLAGDRSPVPGRDGRGRDRSNWAVALQRAAADMSAEARQRYRDATGIGLDR